MTPFELNRCVVGDCRETLRDVPDGTFSCCITSPPYWGLRDYGHPDQIGLESTPDAYVAELVGVFREVRRVLRDDGTLWLNLGDSYAAALGGGQGKNGVVADRSVARLGVRESALNKAAVSGLKPKDLVGIPWLVAFALRADGWWLRSEIIWHKQNPMPESVTDRPTKAHEHVFLLAKSERYAFDADAIKDDAVRAGTIPGGNRKVCADRNDGGSSLPIVADKRNARSVWSMSSEPYSGAHFAAMPRALVKRCMLAGSPEGGAVLDPFFGSGTVGEVAELLGRKWFGCELNPEYAKLIARRTAQTGLCFAGDDGGVR